MIFFNASRSVGRSAVPAGSELIFNMYAMTSARSFSVNDPGSSFGIVSVMTSNNSETSAPFHRFANVAPDCEEMLWQLEQIEPKMSLPRVAWASVYTPADARVELWTNPGPWTSTDTVTHSAPLAIFNTREL